MIEILLLVKEKNKNCIELMNKIHLLNRNIRISQVLSNINECLTIVREQNISIIIIEYNIFKQINSIDLTYIESQTKELIILTEGTLKIKCDKFIISTIEKLVENVKRVLTKLKNEKYIRDIIIKDLKYLGYNLSYCGTKYLVDLICYTYMNFNMYDEKSLIKTYPIIAKKYNKTTNNIKCNITRATSIMFYECEENKLNKYLGTCILPKTGSKIIVHTILNKLNML